MKIYSQNPFIPAAATRKLRKFTDETNMQARNHEHAAATPAFYYYRKDPKCYHTIWWKMTVVTRHFLVLLLDSSWFNITCMLLVYALYVIW